MPSKFFLLLCCLNKYQLLVLSLDNELFMLLLLLDMAIWLQARKRKREIQGVENFVLFSFFKIHFKFFMMKFFENLKIIKNLINQPPLVLCHSWTLLLSVIRCWRCFLFVLWCSAKHCTELLATSSMMMTFFYLVEWEKEGERQKGHK